MVQEDETEEATMTGKQTRRNHTKTFRQTCFISKLTEQVLTIQRHKRKREEASYET
jgi:hypothetical protein